MSNTKSLPDHMRRFSKEHSIRLELLTDENKGILDLMFLPEHQGCFKVGAVDSKADQQAYVDEITHPDNIRAGYIIIYRDQIAGFILMHGKDNLLVGGLRPEFTRKRIYRVARNTFIYAMNKQGIYRITSTANTDNLAMLNFLSKQHQTRWFGDMYINHVNPLIPICEFRLIDVKPDVIDSGYPAVFVSTSPLYKEGDVVSEETLLTHSWELGVRQNFNSVLFCSVGLFAARVYVFVLEHDNGDVVPATDLEDHSVTLAFRRKKPTKVKEVRSLSVTMGGSQSYLYLTSTDGKPARKHSYAKIEEVELYADSRNF